MRIAIVGAGAAGLAAARALAPRHEVVIFEAGARAGGHVHTVAVDGGAVDLGFIVCNRARYPRFFAMLDELGVPTRPAPMSFAVETPDGFSWASHQPLRAGWRFALAVARFLRTARRDVGGTMAMVCTLDEYLEARAVQDDVRVRFARPLAAMLWSLDPARGGELPASLWLAFLSQHGMLDALGSPRWETIPGGAQQYVIALLARMRATVRLSTPVRTVARTQRGVEVNGEPFDRAILATHADTALALLTDPWEEERRLLAAFRYTAHRVVLHGDPLFLPATPASWNSVRGVVTYSMNRLQRLRGAHYLVTLDPPREPRGILAEARMAHPQLDRAALAAQPALARLHHGGIAFAGAHLGFGFHEDAIRSGENAAALVADPFRG